jgi:hypothetical protein
VIGGSEDDPGTSAGSLFARGRAAAVLLDPYAMLVTGRGVAGCFRWEGRGVGQTNINLELSFECCALKYRVFSLEASLGGVL